MIRRRSGRFVRRAAAVPWLVAVWVALWGELTVANLASGTAVALGLVLTFRLPPSEGPPSTFRLLPAIRFAAYFVWKLVEASAIVAWEVVTPGSRVVEGIIAVPLRGTSDMLATLVANCVSLTPGTLTLEFERDPATLYVHVLHLHDVDRVRAEVMHLEALALRAFGSETASRVADASARREDR